MSNRTVLGNKYQLEYQAEIDHAMDQAINGKITVAIGQDGEYTNEQIIDATPEAYAEFDTFAASIAEGTYCIGVYDKE